MTWLDILLPYSPAFKRKHLFSKKDKWFRIHRLAEHYSETTSWSTLWNLVSIKNTSESATGPKSSYLGQFGHNFLTWPLLKNIHNWGFSLTACRYILNSLIFCDHCFLIIWIITTCRETSASYITACRETSASYITALKYRSPWIGGSFFKVYTMNLESLFCVPMKMRIFCHPAYKNIYRGIKMHTLKS